MAVRDRIRDELTVAMKRLGGDPAGELTYGRFEAQGAGPALLSIVGSIDDTLSDDDVLAFLKEHNAGRPVVVEGCPAERPPARRSG